MFKRYLKELDMLTLSLILRKKGCYMNLSHVLKGGFITDTCLIHLTVFIWHKIDKDNINIVGMIVLDLQKALTLSTIPLFIWSIKLQVRVMTSEMVHVSLFLTDSSVLICLECILLVILLLVEFHRVTYFYLCYF